ncbi:TPA: hypothetical protein NBH86_000855 [Serratia marcescens]|nr:hypothetical protein [Serratia marcescens]
MTKPDGDAIESAYRTGLMPLSEIASQHGISEGAECKRAKRDEFQSRSRDQEPVIRSDGLVPEYIN